MSEEVPVPEAAELAMRWFESKQNAVAAELADLFGKYRLSEALMAVYKLFWDEFSSWYLEMIIVETTSSVHAVHHRRVVAAHRRP